MINLAILGRIKLKNLICPSCSKTITNNDEISVISPTISISSLKNISVLESFVYHSSCINSETILLSKIIEEKIRIVNSITIESKENVQKDKILKFVHKFKNLNNKDLIKQWFIERKI